MKKDLWLRLRGYHFANLVPPSMWHEVTEAFGGADASTKAFASKIARKHGWSSGFALRAVHEYKKFVFLGVSGDTIVTPSTVIDTVWHEHVLFTRAYREFCHDVIRRDFDHHPELLPDYEQTSLYVQQYHATLARYRTEFHMVPPADIWGSPKFDREELQRRRDEAVTYDGGGGGDLPLYQHFDGRGDTPGHHDMPEFGGGGEFTGGGAGSDWGDSSDAGGGDAGGGDSGGDGGGCSSGCGGGD